MHPPRDVAIVGAGPAGSALAIRLATAGHRVVLLDRARFPRDKVCGDYIGPRGMRELLELGALIDVCQREQPLPLTGADIYVDDRLITTGRVPNIPGFESFGIAIPRAALDDALFRRAQGLGVETVEGCSVQGFAVTRDGVEVRALVDGTARTFSAKFVVGADGAQSRIARTVQLNIGDDEHTMVTLRGYARGLTVERSCFYFSREFFPGFGWVFPLGSGVVNFGVGMLKSAVVHDEINLHAFYAQLARFIGGREPGESTVSFSASRGWMIKTYGAVRTHSFQRGLLVGEAAGFVDPLSGEGIGHALESARFAADTLSRSLTTGDHSAAQLAEYDRRCATRWDLDLSLADCVVTWTKNRQLRELWLSSIHMLGLLTSSDRRLAATFGGVLAGLVATRDAFSPETVLRAWFRSAQIVQESRSNASWQVRASDWMRVQDGILRAMLSDPESFKSWAVEVHAKHLDIARRWPELSRNQHRV